MDKGRFDGYTVFRNEDVAAYSVYVKKTLTIKKNNLKEYSDLQVFGQFTTFVECFCRIAQSYLVAIFDEVTTRSYYVGHVMEAEPERFRIQRYDINGDKGDRVWMAFSDVNYFSFDTRYERDLAKTIERK